MDFTPAYTAGPDLGRARGRGSVGNARHALIAKTLIGLALTGLGLLIHHHTKDDDGPGDGPGAVSQDRDNFQRMKRATFELFARVWS